MARKRAVFSPEWFPVYLNRIQWSETLAEFTHAQVGLWWDMLLIQWREGRLPMEPADIAAKVKSAFRRRPSTALVASVIHSFPPRGVLSRQNRVLEEIRTEQQTKHAKRVMAGAKGGIAKAMLEQCSTNRVDQTRPDQIREEQSRPEVAGADESLKLVGWCGECDGSGKWAGWLSKAQAPCPCGLGKLRLRALEALRNGGVPKPSAQQVWMWMQPTLRRQGGVA